ncbi:MAG: SGNH/GDSL hydrolase family protein [Cyanobacteria bacterium]|nr:SGNH/GDSL hydrolase family protein [Cyanobacteriota bacterium]
MIKIILAVQGVVLAGLMLLAADMFAHKRVELVGGFNIWGYRGAVVRQRVIGETRILYLGGTRAWGYGTTADGTIAAALEWNLVTHTRQKVTVINAARLGATAADYASMVERHAWVNPDIIVLYDDLGYASTRPRLSKITARARGYEPILPLVLQEKGWMMGQSDSAAKRAAGGAMQTAGDALMRIESYTPQPTQGYAESMRAAIDAALARAVVLVVVDPPENATQLNNLIALRQDIASRGSARVSLLELSDVARAGDLLDGYTYGAVARGRVMSAIEVALLPIVAPGR